MEDVCALREIAGALIREIAPLVGGFSALLTLSFFLRRQLFRQEERREIVAIPFLRRSVRFQLCLSMFIFVVDHSGVAAGIVQVIIFVAMYFLYFHAIDLKDWNS